MPRFLVLWDTVVGFSCMSSLSSCLSYFVPRDRSELGLNCCHISGVASTNRYNQGNNMGVEGGKNETGAGRTEMSTFSYSAHKTTPTRGTAYKNNHENKINRLVHRKCYFLSQAVVLWTCNFTICVFTYVFIHKNWNLKFKWAFLIYDVR